MILYRLSRTFRQHPPALILTPCAMLITAVINAAAHHPLTVPSPRRAALTLILVALAITWVRFTLRWARFPRLIPLHTISVTLFTLSLSLS